MHLSFSNDSHFSLLSFAFRQDPEKTPTEYSVDYYTSRIRRAILLSSMVYTLNTDTLII